MATATAPERLEHLSPVLFNEKPVITTSLLAQVYGCDEHNIRQNLKRNSARFVEGKHFYKLQGKELNDFRLCVTNSHSQNSENGNNLCVDYIDAQNIHPKARTLILWTERGAARHAKMLETDKAWDVFELLEESYFATPRNMPAENNQLALPMLPPYAPTLFEALLLHKVGGLLALMKGNLKRFADQNHIPDATRAQLVDVFEGRQPMTVGVFAAVVHLIGITDIDGLIRHAITEAQSLALMSPSGFTVDAIMKEARKSIGKC